MSNVFTLDSFREEADREFAPVKLELGGDDAVVLRNVLRIQKTRREEVFQLLEKLDSIAKDDEGKQREEDDLDASEMEAMGDIALRMIELVADNDALGSRLVDELRDDLALTLKVFEAWMNATQPGGSRALARLIDEYGDCLVADLWEMYGVDLRDIYLPESRLSPKLALVLIKELPVGSRFYAEKRGGKQFRGWDESRYALVAIVNAVRALQYTYVAAHSKSKPKPPDPFPTPQRTKARQIRKAGSFAWMAAKQIAAARKRKAQT
ncbi:tail assembly chaperone [Mycobacterium phage LarryKay]|nr:tail assembly chaperone [Mycobacterium phage LarryKay]